MKQKLIRNIIVAAAVALPMTMASGASIAHSQVATAPEGTLIHNPSNIKWDPKGPNKRAKVVESPGAPGGQAISIEVKKKPRKVWDVTMKAPFDKDIEKGETIKVAFWARTAKVRKGKDKATIAVVVQRDVEPYDQIINQEFQPSTEWQMYEYTGVAEADFAAAKSDMGFNLGFDKQTVEFGPFYATSLGKTPPLAEPAATPEAEPVVPETAGFAVSGNFAWSHGNGVTTAAVDGEAAGQPGYSITTTAAMPNVWDAHAGASGLGVSVASGDELELKFWARVASGMGDVSAVIQRNAEPYENLATRDLILSPDWQEYTVYGVSAVDVSAEELAVVVHTGHDAQTIELGSFTLSKVN